MTKKKAPPPAPSVNPFHWENKIGPAAVVGVLGILVQVVVVIWVASSIYTGITNKIDNQAQKIELVEKGATTRFETVRDAIKSTRENQITAERRLTSVEVTMGFIKDSIQRLENSVAAATDRPKK